MRRRGVITPLFSEKKVIIIIFFQTSMLIIIIIIRAISIQDNLANIMCIVINKGAVCISVNVYVYLMYIGNVYWSKI